MTFWFIVCAYYIYAITCFQRTNSPFYSLYNCRSEVSVHHHAFPAQFVRVTETLALPLLCLGLLPHVRNAGKSPLDGGRLNWDIFKIQVFAVLISEKDGKKCAPYIVDEHSK